MLLASVCCVSNVSCGDPRHPERSCHPVELSISHSLQQEGQHLATGLEGTSGRVFAGSWWEWLLKLLALGTASDLVSCGSTQKVRDGR